MVARVQGEASAMETTTAVVFYCLCSGGMLLVNKLAVYHLNFPGLLTTCQFSVCSIFVFTCKLCGLLQADDFEWSKAKFFLLYVCSFAVGTYTNMKVLSMANVETVIVFRSCTPLAVAVFDYIFYNRAIPSARSMISLLCITAGAVSYIASDRQFQVHGISAYYWVLLWWVVLVFQLTYGKFLVTGIPLKSLWTPVLYTNTFSILPALALCMMGGELNSERLAAASVTPDALFWLISSCVIGIGISWAGFWCQSLVSATTYTVVGVMNKMLTVTMNTLIWDKHASPSGIASLCVCLLAGSLYKQAPLRDNRGAGMLQASELAEGDRGADEPLKSDVSEPDEDAASNKI